MARFTLDYWKTSSDVFAEFVTDVHLPERADGFDRFNFDINLADQTNLEAKTLFFCVKYCVNGQEYWDNNDSANFKIYFKKKPKQQDTKEDMQAVPSQPLQTLLKGKGKSLLATSTKPKSIYVAFDEQHANGIGKIKPFGSDLRWPHLPSAYLQIALLDVQ